MDASKKKKLVLLIDELERKYGKGVIYTIDSKYAKPDLVRLPIGLPDFDESIGGGIPQGRIMEVFGPESAGKTSVCYMASASAELSIYIDMEGSFDSARAKMFGNRKGQMLVRRPDWGEQAMEMIIDFAAAGVPLITLDSVPSMIPRKEYDGTDMEKREGVALVAGLLSRKLPKLVSLCEKYGTTVIFINQVRDKIGGPLFGDPFVTPGGHALKHFASLRVQVARKQWLEHPRLGRFGQIIKTRVVKSKVCNPYQESELALIFQRGFVPLEDIDTVKKELMAEARKNGRV